MLLMMFRVMSALTNKGVTIKIVYIIVQPVWFNYNIFLTVMGKSSHTDKKRGIHSNTPAFFITNFISFEKYNEIHFLIS